MFGYVCADTAHLTEAQFARYRGGYCGLCRALGRECGGVCRACLTYDMTFLLLLLSSLYEPEQTRGAARCAVHPMKKHEWWENEVSVYAAHMNAALAYYKCLDDWQDEKRLHSLLYARLLAPAAERARTRFSRQCEAMRESLEKIAALEKEHAGIDALCAAFGALMAELFVWREDRWSPLLRQFGDALGRLVYAMDAVCDLEEDRRRGRFNPLLPFGEDGAHFRPHLTLLAAEAAERFERLPLVQDAELLRNVLYSGVWLPYERRFAPEKRPVRGKKEKEP